MYGNNLDSKKKTVPNLMLTFFFIFKNKFINVTLNPNLRTSPFIFLI